MLKGIWQRRMCLAGVSGLVLLMGAAAWGQSPGVADGVAGEAGGNPSLLDFVQAGGVVGYVILALSVAGVALVVDGYLRTREEKLLPPELVEHVMGLAQKGRFSELLGLCRTNPTLLGRVIGRGLSDGTMGLDAVREGIEQEGAKEMTKLNQRIGYIGFIASVAPMLGLLGTVTGMIQSFNVLGQAKGAARPDQLAVGISEALVTTCMGLIVAVPLMFFYNHLRDRVTRVGQEAAGVSEKLLRVMSVVIESRQSPKGQGPVRAQVNAESAESTS